MEIICEKLRNEVFRKHRNHKKAVTCVGGRHYGTATANEISEILGKERQLVGKPDLMLSPANYSSFPNIDSIIYI